MEEAGTDPWARESKAAPGYFHHLLWGGMEGQKEDAWQGDGVLTRGVSEGTVSPLDENRAELQHRDIRQRGFLEVKRDQLPQGGWKQSPHRPRSWQARDFFPCYSMRGLKEAS